MLDYKRSRRHSVWNNDASTKPEKAVASCKGAWQNNDGNDGMNTLIVALTLLAIFLVTLVMFISFEEMSFGLATGGENSRVWQISTIVVGCFLGIFSKQIFDRVTAAKRRYVYPSRDFLLAGVVSPLVIYPIYSSVGPSADLFIVFLVSYQNGFFFSSTITYLEAKFAKREESS